MNGIPAKKSGYEVRETDTVSVTKDKRTEFVSRSAIKLDTFLEEIGLNVENMTCLDIGASTGGFTQALLMRWAKSVHTVDVGTMQLHSSIREDARVICMENTDIRNFQASARFDLIVGDISFISLTKIMDSILSLADTRTEMILLYKPQFEVGSENLRKTGVPKSEVIVEKKFREFQEFLRLRRVETTYISLSTIEGEAGNKEYMMRLRKQQ